MDPLHTAFEALRRRDGGAALSALEGVRPADPTLAARACAYRAQALRELGRLDEAERAAAEAVRHARQAGDTQGLTELRALHASILAGIAAVRTAEAARSRDFELLDVSIHVLLVSPDKLSLLLRKSNALLDAGRIEEAIHVSCVAREHARAAASPRDEVLAVLSLARAEPGRAVEHVLAAHAIADASDDMNLVTAVAHAARAAGVSLPPPAFG